MCIRAGAALLAALASLDTGRYRNICGLLPCSLVFSCATSVLSPCIQPGHMLVPVSRYTCAQSCACQPDARRLLLPHSLTSACPLPRGACRELQCLNRVLIRQQSADMSYSRSCRAPGAQKGKCAAYCRKHKGKTDCDVRHPRCRAAGCSTGAAPPLLAVAPHASWDTLVDSLLT